DGLCGGTGVGHRRYARVVCAHTSASGCSPTRCIPGWDQHQLVRWAGPQVNPRFWPASGGRLHLDHPRLWCVVLDRFNALVPGGSGLILLAGAYHLMVGRLEIEHELAWTALLLLVTGIIRRVGLDRLHAIETT